MIINLNFIKTLVIVLIPFINLILPDILKAETVKLLLKDGSEITGIIIKERSDNSKLVVTNEFLGSIEIPINSLTDNKSNKEIIKQFKELEEVKYTANPFLDNTSRWNSNFSGGFSSTSSKSRESKSYSFSADTEYKGDLNTYNISTNYGYNESSSNSRKTVGSNSGSLDILKDRILNNKLSFYSTLHYNFDERDLVGKHRIQKSLGLGYYLLKQDAYSLQTLVGPAAIFHSGGEFCSDTKYCGELIPGWDLETLFRWHINQKLDLNISDVYSLASMNRLTGANYLRTRLRFRPYVDKDLFLSLFFENSHYEFRPNEPTNRLRFEVGKRF